MRELCKRGTKFRIPDKRWYEDNSQITLINNTFTRKLGINAFTDRRLVAVLKPLINWCQLTVKSFTKQYPKENLKIDELLPFCKKFISNFSSLLETYKDRRIIGFDFSRRSIKQLKQKFVISYVDKFANKFLFFCPKYYASIVLQEFAPSLCSKNMTQLLDVRNLLAGDRNSTYIVSADNADTIHTTLCHFLESQKICCERPKSVDPNVDKEPIKVNSYPAVLGKLHKIPIKFRFLACSASYELRPLSIWLSRAFKFLEHEFKRLWSSTLCRAGTSFRNHSVWVCNDSQVIPEMIKDLNRSIPLSKRNIPVPLKTFDFTKMYTNIELTDLKSCFKNLFEEVFAANKKYLLVHREDTNCGW